MFPNLKFYTSTQTFYVAVKHGWTIVSNSLININNMTCIRKDRKSDVKDYKIHIFSGGVCIYVTDKWNNYTSVVDYGKTISEHFEILTIQVNRPCYK